MKHHYRVVCLDSRDVDNILKEHARAELVAVHIVKEPASYAEHGYTIHREFYFSLDYGKMTKEEIVKMWPGSIPPAPLGT